MDHVSEAAGELSEGFVARFASNGTGPHTRFKLKFPAYTAAHRAVFGLNSARVWEAAACEAAYRIGLSAKQAAGALRLSPERAAGLLDRGAGPVEGLRSTLPEEFLPWFDAAVAEVSADAAERIRLYETLTRQAAEEAGDGSDRAFAAAAQRLAAGSGVQTGPMFSLRRGRKDARLAIWRQAKPSAQITADASAALSRAAGGRTSRDGACGLSTPPSAVRAGSTPPASSFRPRDAPSTPRPSQPSTSRKTMWTFESKEATA